MNAEAPSLLCPFCGARSHNPNDIEHRYCGRCHVFIDDEVRRRGLEMKDRAPYVRMQPAACPFCGLKLNAATEMKGEGVAPTPGDLNVCVACAGPSRWTAAMGLEPLDLDSLTPEERRGVEVAVRNVVSMGGAAR